MQNDIFMIPIWEYPYEKNLVERRASYFLIEGKNEKEAKINLTKEVCFIKNYNKLSEEQRRRTTPFTLRKGKIERIPECGLRNKNERGEYICGKELCEKSSWPNGILESIGEFGYCCIMGYDIPELPNKFECPLKKKRELIFQI